MALPEGEHSVNRERDDWTRLPAVHQTPEPSLSGAGPVPMMVFLTDHSFGGCMTEPVDLVPADLRAAWVEAGDTPGVDLRTLFARQVKQHPDKVAVVDDDKSTTYAEIGDMADRIAGLLGEWGIGQGDVVALQLPNVAEACAADLAVAGVG